MAERDYNAAVSTLNSLQTNFSIVNAIRKSGGKLNESAIPEMLEFARRIGYQPSDFKKFRPIHVAGTKGKGSTSAFIASILDQYAKSKGSPAIRKVALYTSPHLRFVRERIQIDNEPISESLFAKYFFEVWDRLAATSDGSKPVYFRYLTLMAFHAFIQEGVDSAIIECGIGGEYDSTNIVDSPSVTAITALSIDHIFVLGETLPEIAWHKAGIFKSGSPAFTVPQPESAMEVLQRRAEEKNVHLVRVERNSAIESGVLKLGLAGDFQKSNASLAVATAASYLQSIGVLDLSNLAAGSMPPEFVKGLEQVHWPGRCDLRRQGNISWCLDGAHTLDSIEVAGQWFSEVQNQTSRTKSATRILIFNQQTRDASALARALHRTLSKAISEGSPFSHCIFTTNITYKDGSYKPDLIAANSDPHEVHALKVQKELASVWTELDPKTNVLVAGTIEESVHAARDIAKTGSGDEVLVLITGSLHLVGGALEVLESEQMC